MILGQFDAIAYEVLEEKEPETLQRLKEALDAGLTARQIERRLNWKFGRRSVAAQMCICAAYHYESIRKQAKENENK